MKALRILALGMTAVSMLLSSSCKTLEKEPKPEGERLSSMPHNMPASWEGQAGMPGMMSGQY